MPEPSEKFVRPPSRVDSDGFEKAPPRRWCDCLADQRVAGRGRNPDGPRGEPRPSPGIGSAKDFHQSKAHEVKSPSSVRLGPVALRILSYLRTHKHAQDTLEGIAEWWLLEQRIRYVSKQVKQALAELVEQGMVLKRIGRDGRAHYRLNIRKRKAATQLLGAIASEPSVVPAGSNAGEVRRHKWTG
jgi:hypothetical protein